MLSIFQKYWYIDVDVDVSPNTCYHGSLARKGPCVETYLKRKFWKFWDWNFKDFERTSCIQVCRHGRAFSCLCCIMRRRPLMCPLLNFFTLTFNPSQWKWRKNQNLVGKLKKWQQLGTKNFAIWDKYCQPNTSPSRVT